MKPTDTLYGIHTVLMLLQTRPHDVVSLTLQSNRQDARMQKIKMLADQYHIPCKLVERVAFEKLTSEKNHQGVVAIAKSLLPWSEKELLDCIAKQSHRFCLLVLDGVQDPHNLGACLRSANAFGALAVIIPKDRAASMTDVVKKVASGAAEVTPLVVVSNLHRTLDQLKKENVWLVGLDGEAEQNIAQVDFNRNVAIVMGAEGFGLRRLTRETCDYITKIDMTGSVESLNVSVATGIALYCATNSNIK